MIVINLLSVRVFKDVDSRPRTGSSISLTVADPKSFGDFPKIKKQLIKGGK